MAQPTLIVRVAATLEELKKNLAEGKSQIETTTAAMQRMAASFTGDKLIQAAHNTVAAVVAIGGASKLTETEMARVNSTMERALEKFRVLGKEAPLGMRELADYTRQSAAASDRLHGSLSQFDRLLASVGVNLGSEIGALRELGEASGKSVSQLGLLATAGLAVGVAMAGWKIGRLIADWFDLDNKIAHATATLLGWGDVAAETAGAKQDAINLAISRGAAATVSYSEAIQFNSKWVKDHTEHLKQNEKAYADWKAAVDEVNAGGLSWRETLDTIDGATVEAAKVFLDAGYSVKTLTDYFGLSERQMKAVEVALKADKEEIDAVNAGVKDLTAAWAETDKIMREFATKTHAIAMTAMREEAAEQRKLLAERNNAVIEGLKTIQGVDKQIADLTTQSMLSAKDAQIAKIRETAAAQLAAFKGTEQQLQDYTFKVQQLTELQVTAIEQGATEIGAKVPAAIGAPLQAAAEDMGEGFRSNFAKAQKAFESFQGVVVAGTGVMAEMMAVTDAGSFTERQRQMQEAQRLRGEIFLTGMSSGRLPVQSRQSGGDVSAGRAYVVGERRPELFVPRTAGTILPSVGGAAAPVINIYITQPLGTPQAIAAAVDDALMARQSAIGVRG